MGQRLNTLGSAHLLFIGSQSTFPAHAAMDETTCSFESPTSLRHPFAAARQRTSRKILGPTVSARRGATVWHRRTRLSFFGLRHGRELQPACNSRRSSPAESRGLRVTSNTWRRGWHEKRRHSCLTAHMGSFELGTAALRQFESRMHVVLQAGRWSANSNSLRAEHASNGSACSKRRWMMAGRCGCDCAMR